MHDRIAINLTQVSKEYQLFGSQREQLLSFFAPKFFRRQNKRPSFKALSKVSFSLDKGERLGIIGANGAGKTTLLKLIAGQYSPSEGFLEVNGAVQSLLTTGTGFNPDFTGRENIIASLEFSGLSPKAVSAAIDDVIDFCELDIFIDQPFKNYSSGMQARLMFACATAAEPDILIVDEVLGAGDAYFVAKCKQRVDRLISNGCSMILVSHSMQQVLELCSRVIWLENGRIKKEGPSLEIVKLYEKHMNSRVNNETEDISNDAQEGSLKLDSKVENDNKIDMATEQNDRVAGVLALRKKFPSEIKFITKTGLSFWESETNAVTINGFTILRGSEETNILVTGEPVAFLIKLAVKKTLNDSLRAGLNIIDHNGQVICKVFSDPINVDLAKDDEIVLLAEMNPLRIGPGQYVLGLSVTGRAGALEAVNTEPRHCLLSRSIDIEIRFPESQQALSCAFLQKTYWSEAHV